MNTAERNAPRLGIVCAGLALFSLLLAAQAQSVLLEAEQFADPAEMLKCECKDKDALSLSVNKGDLAAPFPRCPWAVDLTDKPFPGRRNLQGQWTSTPFTFATP